MNDDEIAEIISQFSLDAVVAQEPRLKNPLAEAIFSLAEKYPENTLEQAGIVISVSEDKIYIRLEALNFEDLEVIQDKLEDYGIVHETWCKNMNDDLTGARYDRVDNLTIRPCYDIANIKLHPAYDNLEALNERLRAETDPVKRERLQELITIVKRIHYMS